MIEMDSYLVPKRAFVRDLWARAGTQLAISNIITITADDFVRLGDDGEKFFKGQLRQAHFFFHFWPMLPIRMIDFHGDLKTDL